MEPGGEGIFYGGVKEMHEGFWRDTRRRGGELLVLQSF